MNANLAMLENHKGIICMVGGTEIKVFGKAAVLTRKPTWHDSGTVYPAGLPAMKAKYFLDPNGNFETWLDPIYTRQVLENGQIRLIQQPFAMITRNPEIEGGDNIVYGKPVYVGSMTPEMWAERNSNPARPTRSDLRDEFGDKVLLESAGFLGKNGLKGFFLSVKLPSWDKAVAKALGTEVDEYFHVYVDPRGMIHIYNTSIVAVCQNTVMFGIAKASRILRVDQTDGATERVRIAVGDMWGNSMATRNMAQESALYLASQPMNEDEMRVVAEAVYQTPTEPDPTFRAKSSWEARMDDYKFKMDTVEGYRDTLVQVYTDPKWQSFVGITPEVAGTAFGGYQAVTGMLSWQPFKNNGHKFESTFAGDIKNKMMRGYNTIMGMKKEGFKPAELDVIEAEVEYAG